MPSRSHQHTRTPGLGVASFWLVSVLAVGCSHPFTTPVSEPRPARPVLGSSSAPQVSGAMRPSTAATARVFGRSVKGRPLVSYWAGDHSASRRVLVIGVIHGNEAAGLPIAQALRSVRPTHSELVVVPNLNPDGTVLRTRQNANGVDLNRNFPWHWMAAGRPGDQQYPGRAALSEPESQALARLIKDLRPTLTVWFHQPVGVIDESGGSIAVERRFAQLAGEPLRQLTRYQGSAVSWENALLPHTTAFVVELTKNVTPEQRRQLEAAVTDLAH